VKRVSCEPGGDALHVIPRMAEEKLAMIAALTAQFVPRHQPRPRKTLNLVMIAGL
jgi:hypothetical protein